MASDELFNRIAAQSADRVKESDAAFAALNGGKVSQEMGEDPELTAIFNASPMATSSVRRRN